MHFKYALLSEDENGNTFYEEDVPQVVAEVEGERGRYAVFSTNDARVSSWMKLDKGADVRKEWEKGSKNAGPTQRDSMQQPIQPGDYLVSHGYEFRGLDLNIAIRATKTKVVAENLSGWYSETRMRHPEALLRIPAEMITGGEPAQIEFETLYATSRRIEKGCTKDTVFDLVDEATARASKNGYFSLYERSNGVSVTDWIPFAMDQWELEALQAKKHGNKPIVEELEIPHKDAFGAELQVGDWVFTGDNHYSDFMLAKVIGFTDVKVRLHGYRKDKWRHLIGEHEITTNWPLNVIKLPVTIYS